VALEKFKKTNKTKTKSDILKLYANVK